MRDFFLLKVLDRFKKIFLLLGIDYQVMRCILQVKLLMDTRRTPTVFANKKKENQKESNRFLHSLGFNLIFGLFMIFLILGKNYIFQMSLLFGILMFMITTVMVSDFSSVLLDIKEKNIIYTKPVHRKTINMAKFIHIFYYLTLLTLSLAGPSLLISIFIHGIPFGLIYVSLLILLDLLIIVMTSFTYLIMLKFFDGEKLKDMINYVQIAMTIVITIGYQLVNQAFRFIGFKFEFVYEVKWWHYFIPPFWFASPFEVILKQNTTPSFITMSAFAIIMPFLGIMIYIKLIPSFERNLQKLNNNEMGKKRVKTNKINFRFNHLVCFNKQERIFYNFAKEMFKNEREFKLRLYPSLGLSIIFPFIFMFSFLSTNDFQNLAHSKFYFYIYFSAIMLPTALMLLKYSSSSKGAWIYKTTPIVKLKPIITGTLKAFIIRLLLPIFFIQSIIFMVIFGLTIWLDLVIVLISFLIFSTICFNMMGKGLPFTKSYDEFENQGAKVFLIVFILLLFVGFHLLASFFNLTYYYLILLLIVNFLFWKFTLNLKWEQI